MNPKTGKAYRSMMINMPPRFGKTSTTSLFSEWVLGENIQLKLIAISYNEKLSGRFAKSVRNGIDETKADELLVIYEDIFPNTKIKQGDSSYQLWSLEGTHFSFLATSFSATITGMGADIGMIDDPIKNHIEANNIEKLEDQYEWYTDTFLSRLEEGALKIITMTRWATGDLCGKLLELEPEKWYVLVYEAMDRATGKMLSDSMLSRESYDEKRSLMNPAIFEANYHQSPVDLKGTLYKGLKEYEVKIDGEYLVLVADGRELNRISNIECNKSEEDLFQSIIAYGDTADEGSDYLCVLPTGTFNGQGFIRDVLYTDEGMEVTEPKTAWLLVKNEVQFARIESNRGGKAFARMVKEILWNTYKNRDIRVTWFTQKVNKQSRIITNSNWVCNNIFFPKNWKIKYPEFYKALSTYQKDATGQHDDAPDTLTGIAEMLRNNAGLSKEEKQEYEQFINSMMGLR